MLVFLNATYSLPFASPSACETQKTPWQDFSLMMRKESPRSCPPRRRKPLPKRTQPLSEITVGWACYVPGAAAVDSLNLPAQIQRPHQAGTRGLRSWTRRSSVSGKREGRGDGSAWEWGWECRLGQAAAVPAVPLRGREMPPQPIQTAQLRTRRPLCPVFCFLGPSIPLTPGDTPVRKKEELLFDDGDDIMATLGFGDSPKAERRQAGDQ